MKTKLIRLDFKGMQEIITLPEPDEMVRIWTIINEHGFCFDKFTLVVEPLQNTFKVHIEGRGDNQIIHIKRIWKDRNGIAHTENRDITIDTFFDKYSILMQDFFKDGYKVAKDNDTVDLLMPFHFMQYLVYSDLHRSIEYIEPAERKPGNKTRSKAKSSYQELSLTDCIKIYHHKNKNRSYTRRTEQWERRGGIRHMKNGKIVPYSGTTCRPKNNGNDKSGKEYRL